MGSLAVLPSYQGRGIAQQLTAYGLALADDRGEDIYLEASPAARRLYERNGFQAFAEVELIEGYPMVPMLRKSPK